MKKMSLLAAFVAVIVIMTGCISTPGVIMDKTKPIEQGGYTVVGEEVSATEVMVFIFGVPLSDVTGSVGRRMYKRALNDAPGADALVEYVVDTKQLAFPGLPFSVIWYTLTGTPVKTNK